MCLTKMNMCLTKMLVSGMGMGGACVFDTKNDDLILKQMGFY